MAGINSNIQSSQSNVSPYTTSNPPHDENKNSMVIDHANREIVSGGVKLELHPSLVPLPISYATPGRFDSVMLALSQHIQFAVDNTHTMTFTHVVGYPTEAGKIESLGDPWPFRLPFHSDSPGAFFQQQPPHTILPNSSAAYSLIALNHAVGKPLVDWSECMEFWRQVHESDDAAAAQKMLSLIQSKLPGHEVQTFSLDAASVKSFVDQLGFQFILMRGKQATAFRQYENGYWAEIPVVKSSPPRHDQQLIGNDRALGAEVLNRVNDAAAKDERIYAFSWKQLSTAGDLVRHVLTKLLPELLPLVLHDVQIRNIFDAVLEGPTSYGELLYPHHLKKDTLETLQCMLTILNGHFDVGALLRYFPTSPPRTSPPPGSTHPPTRCALLDLKTDSSSFKLPLWKRHLLNIRSADSIEEIRQSLDWLAKRITEERIAKEANAEATQEIPALAIGENGSPTGTVQGDIVHGLIAAVPGLLSIETRMALLMTPSRLALSKQAIQMVRDETQHLDPEAAQVVCVQSLHSAGKMLELCRTATLDRLPVLTLYDLRFQAIELIEWVLASMKQKRDGAPELCSWNEELPALKALVRAFPQWSHSTSNLPQRSEANISRINQLNRLVKDHAAYLHTAMADLPKSLHDELLNELLKTLINSLEDWQGLHQQSETERIVSDALIRVKGSNDFKRASLTCQPMITALLSAYRGPLHDQFLLEIKNWVKDAQSAHDQRSTDAAAINNVIRAAAFLRAFSMGPVPSQASQDHMMEVEDNTKETVWNRAIEDHGKIAVFKAFTDCVTAMNPRLIRERFARPDNYPVFLNDIATGIMLLRQDGTSKERFALLDKLANSLGWTGVAPAPPQWEELSRKLTRLILSNPKGVSPGQYGILLASVLTRVPIKDIGFPTHEYPSGVQSKLTRKWIQMSEASRVKLAIAAVPSCDLDIVLTRMTGWMFRDAERATLFLDIADACIDKLSPSKAMLFLLRLIMANRYQVANTAERPLGSIHVLQKGLDRVRAGGFNVQEAALRDVFRASLITPSGALTLYNMADKQDLLSSSIANTWFNVALNFLHAGKAQQMRQGLGNNDVYIDGIADGVTRHFSGIVDENESNRILTGLGCQLGREKNLPGIVSFSLAVDKLPKAMQKVWLKQAIGLLAGCNQEKWVMLCRNDYQDLDTIGRKVTTCFDNLESDSERTQMLTDLQAGLRKALTPYPFALLGIERNHVPLAMSELWFTESASFINRASAIDTMGPYGDAVGMLDFTLACYLRGIEDMQERERKLALVEDGGYRAELRKKVDEIVDDEDDMSDD